MMHVGGKISIVNEKDPAVPAARSRCQRVRAVLLGSTRRRARSTVRSGEQQRVLAVEYSVVDGSITRNSLAHRGVADATL